MRDGKSARWTGANHRECRNLAAWPGSPALEIVARMRQELLDWYDRNKRDLPWRHTNDPYAIWVSEIMLQQTRVAVVIERWKSFLERFPTCRHWPS